jgi:hypothetical protein
MTVIEVSILIVAIASVAFTAAAIIALVRLLRLWSRADLLLRDARETLRRLDVVAAELAESSRDAARVRRRVTSTANRLLDEVEPPIRQVAAILSGLRVGLGALFGPSPNGSARPGRTAEKPLRTEEPPGAERSRPAEGSARAGRPVPAGTPARARTHESERNEP